MTRRSSTKDTPRAILRDLVAAAIPCYSGYTKRAVCHGIADSTLLVRRAKRLLRKGK